MVWDSFIEVYLHALKLFVLAVSSFLVGHYVGHYRGQIDRVNKLTNGYIDKLEEENKALKDGVEDS